jgi:hypothetical protein
MNTCLDDELTLWTYGEEEAREDEGEDNCQNNLVGERRRGSAGGGHAVMHGIRV